MTRFSSSTRRRTPVALALIGLVSSLPAAFAQQAVQPAAPSSTASSPAPGTSVPTTLREVQVQGAQDKTGFGANPSTISRLPADLRDAPQSITVINQAVMQSQAATSLASALRNVPGLTIGGAEGGQIGTNINLNGFSWTARATAPSTTATPSPSSRSRCSWAPRRCCSAAAPPAASSTR